LNWLYLTKNEKVFSKACEYGIKAIVYIAQEMEELSHVSLTDISNEIDSPLPYTAKILQQLVRGGILRSKKGPNGGFYLEKDVLKRITLATIVSTIDGDSIYTGCGLGLKNCDEKKPCPMHESFKAIRQDLRFMLENTKVDDLSKGLAKKLTYLKN
jgi:Rrf2 family iron-sulfur cluster assembly transcriptional regulator